jgi:hypothetical protein
LQAQTVQVDYEIVLVEAAGGLSSKVLAALSETTPDQLTTDITDAMHHKDKEGTVVGTYSPQVVEITKPSLEIVEEDKDISVVQPIGKKAGGFQYLVASSVATVCTIALCIIARVGYVFLRRHGRPDGPPVGPECQTSPRLADIADAAAEECVDLRDSDLHGHLCEAEVEKRSLKPNFEQLRAPVATPEEGVTIIGPRPYLLQVLEWQEAVARLAQEQASASRIVLDNTTDAALGVGVSVTSLDGKTLLIDAIAGGAEGDGLVQKWNKENPSNAIEVGDRILEVNDIRGNAGDLLDECKQHKVLEMLVQLRGRPQEAVGQQADLPGAKPRRRRAAAIAPRGHGLTTRWSRRERVSSSPRIRARSLSEGSSISKSSPRISSGGSLDSDEIEFPSPEEPEGVDAPITLATKVEDDEEPKWDAVREPEPEEESPTSESHGQTQGCSRQCAIKVSGFSGCLAAEAATFESGAATALRPRLREKKGPRSFAQHAWRQRLCLTE